MIQKNKKSHSSPNFDVFYNPDFDIDHFDVLNV